MSDFEEFLNLPEAEGEPQNSGRAKGKRSKPEARSRADQKGKRTKPAEEPAWASPIRPSMNFVPQKERDVEYARRAKRNGMLLVAASVAVIAVWSGGLGVSAHSMKADLKELSAAGDQDKGYLIANSEATTFYADYMDQRAAASKKFESEVSPTKLLNEARGAAPKGIDIGKVTYDDAGEECGIGNPFSTTLTVGCVSISGSASNPGTLAKYTSSMSGDGSVLVDANYSEVKSLGKNKTQFDLKAWFTQEAFSNRAEGIAPTDEERALVVRQLVQLNQFQTPKDGAN